MLRELNKYVLIFDETWKPSKVSHPKHDIAQNFFDFFCRHFKNEFYRKLQKIQTIIKFK